MKRIFGFVFGSGAAFCISFSADLLGQMLSRALPWGNGWLPMIVWWVIGVFLEVLAVRLCALRGVVVAPYVIVIFIAMVALVTHPQHWVPDVCVIVAMLVAAGAWCREARDMEARRQVLEALEAARKKQPIGWN
jgi:hypothetical protein